MFSSQNRRSASLVGLRNSVSCRASCVRSQAGVSFASAQTQGDRNMAGLILAVMSSVLKSPPRRAASPGAEDEAVSVADLPGPVGLHVVGTDHDHLELAGQADVAVAHPPPVVVRGAGADLVVVGREQDLAPCNRAAMATCGNDVSWQMITANRTPCAEKTGTEVPGLKPRLVAVALGQHDLVVVAQQLAAVNDQLGVVQAVGLLPRQADHHHHLVIRRLRDEPGQLRIIERPRAPLDHVAILVAAQEALREDDEVAASLPGDADGLADRGQVGREVSLLADALVGRDDEVALERRRPGLEEKCRQQDQKPGSRPPNPGAAAIASSVSSLPVP